MSATFFSIASAVSGAVPLCPSRSLFPALDSYSKTIGMVKIKPGCARRGGADFRAFPIGTPEPLITEMGKEGRRVMDPEEESREPMSLSNLFEIVADDLHILNQNLMDTVVGNRVLMSAAKHVFEAGGKRIRPALVFLVSRATAESTGNNTRGITSEQQRLAEVIEMLHTATLIHDDILDESDRRRGKETIHQVYDTRIAVLVGDFLFAHSMMRLADLDNLHVVKLLSQAVKDLATGESQQATSLFNCDVKIDDYLYKSFCKTASLIAASAKSAAIFSCPANQHVVDQMYEFGKNLGLSFQIVDDVLDLTQPAEQLGKPGSGSDLSKGNLTAPVIFAMEEDPRLRDIIGNETSEFRPEEALDIIKSGGGIERALELAKEKADLALVNFRCLSRSAYKSALKETVLFNLERIN